MTSFDVVVVGAGPAGMAAATAASTGGANVCIVDENAHCGGQIWRGYDLAVKAPDQRFVQLRSALERGQVVVRYGTRVVANPARYILRLETATSAEDIRYRRLILATGARERFLPFPGWSLPGVMGAGGLQAMIKQGLQIEGKRVVLSGSGPLLLAVAANLSKNGAHILGIFEQASAARLARFGLKLLRHPGKLRDGTAYRSATLSIPYRTGSWVTQAQGKDRLQSVTVAARGSTRTIACDYLGCGFHLIPNLELPRLLQCALRSGYVHVNEQQETSVKDVYCVGESTGVGGLEKALCEGEIAGLVSAGRSAAHLFKRRDRYRRFARELDRTFTPRPELSQLAAPDTLICRCEDVSREALGSMHSWREAKLHTRCGMGPCQGRICGPAAEFLLGWNAERSRPPALPARLSTLGSPIEKARSTM
ncbi:FAD/NAD(P)-binding oxidoreductase [Telmatobacter sp. DSM 110680]|uniref:FAD/NAD(P)-binding oxidoreductase n=1 Tax=Telmatobacter sp. DSM 110680 TaxID=3036704 RepID=A0AAU7DMM6_9BACT